MAMKELENKTALITGGSRGLGFEIAKAFLQNGANVIICARHEKDVVAAGNQLSDFFSSELRTGQRISVRGIDISNRDHVDKIFEDANKEYGEIDIVVNNAAIQGPIGRIEDTDWAEWERAVSINLFGTAYCMRAAIKYFRNKNRRGKIINISGGGATGSRPYFSSYAAAKVAIVRLTEILADENKEYGIDINAIAPGAMNTQMMEEILNAGPDKAGKKEIEIAKKLKTNGDEAREKASGLAVFLASDKSEGITGKLISAIWDDWNTLENNVDLGKDVFTLRRVVE